MKAILSALSVGLALMVMGTSASAVPFSYRFESKLTQPFGVFGAAGDPASITVTLDNGGTSDRSQVWTAADLDLVIFNIDNGLARAVFFKPFDRGLTTSDGSFATDSAGNLISAPSDWSDTDVTREFVTNFSFVAEMNWFIDGSNFVLFDDENFGPTVQLGLADVEGTTDPANWSRVTALPLPPTLLLLLVGLGGVVLLRRAGPGFATKPPLPSTAVPSAVTADVGVPAAKRSFEQFNLGVSMKALLSALSVGLALMVMGTSASAVPFSYRFESSVDRSSYGLPASTGDPASITVTLDNGGASIVNQVWTAAHLQSVTFDINNGAATISFFSPFDGGLISSSGNFATDAAGNLTSVMDNWADRIVTADFFASVPFVGGLDWFINGANGVVFDNSISNSRFQLFLPNVQGNTDPANWSRVAVLPLPPTLLLLLVGLAGVALLRRAGPGHARGVIEARGA